MPAAYMLVLFQLLSIFFIVLKKTKQVVLRKKGCYKSGFPYISESTIYSLIYSC
jgi:hypothetical protein